MDDDSTVLNELVKAKDCIKRKYIALKTGEANVQKLMSETLKPIIEPLIKISNANNLFSNHYETPQITNSNKQKYESADNISNDENILDDSAQQLRIENWFKSIDFDRTYGPKKLSDSNIILGNKVINFTQNTLNIEDVVYPLTLGLVRLIFLKHSTLYTEYDLETYKKILIQTSAHLTLDGTKIKSVGDKYKNIIIKLFPSGGGLSVKLQKFNYLFWDDPNELVDRLRLLLASKSAGNTGVSNEILSIFEELLEAGLIKRIPNV